MGALKFFQHNGLQISTIHRHFKPRPKTQLPLTNPSTYSKKEKQYQREGERDMEDEHRGQSTESDQNKNKKKTVIKIPSFQEVLESSQSKSTPPSLFTPSQSFSQAFAFVKSSEFYSPPPPPATSSQPLQASDTGNSRYSFTNFNPNLLCVCVHCASDG